MELFDAITQRRSHRGEFRDDAISQEDLDKLIEAARWAALPIQHAALGVSHHPRSWWERYARRTDRTECCRSIQRQHFSGRQ